MNANAQRLELFDVLKQPDRTGLPKYQRLANTLLDAIRRGLWRPGDRLPAEEELAQMTPFSLGTVQRALRDLADQGLVIRQHGLGSFVAEKPRQLQDPWHCRFLGDDGVTVLPIFSQAVQRATIRGDGPWTPYLGRQDVMRLDRIIDINGEFKIFSRFFADRTLLNRLWETPMDKLHGANFKKMIARQCQLPITDITHLVSIAPFDAESCERIAVAHDTTGLYMQAVARAGRDLCVYYQQFFIAPNQRVLVLPEHTPASQRA
ncbi:GntR family transcriptional regulator [Variovorax sp. PBL-E5]|uniref:GntR family transcriptional regulator n=1 Tax=Variovorax sp. PBL-E5 TaxID=434014 RepID=UPI0013194D72|nr:GntR family transcriptional regulator [Variovorax sp. PBL-E5]VTU30461.1 putative HTH-type transcriptional regulator YurK [Variovorax sp. PBL-E5]